MTGADNCRILPRVSAPDQKAGASFAHDVTVYRTSLSLV